MAGTKSESAIVTGSAIATATAPEIETEIGTGTVTGTVTGIGTEIGTVIGLGSETVATTVNVAEIGVPPVAVSKGEACPGAAAKKATGNRPGKEALLDVLDSATARGAMGGTDLGKDIDPGNEVVPEEDQGVGLGGAAAAEDARGAPRGGAAAVAAEAD